MPLASAQIVDAIAARLSGASITPAGTRVYTSRAWPLQEDQLPAWRVTAEAEDIEPQTMHYPELLEHTLTVELEGTVQATADVDDAMHAMALAALQRLFGTQANAILAPLNVSRFQPASIQRLFTTQGESRLAQVVVSLTVVFNTYINDPTVIVS